MKKYIRRHGNVIIAEVMENDPIIGYVCTVSKKFNNLLSLFGFQPDQCTYDRANEWADKVIELHLKNTKEQG